MKTFLLAVLLAVSLPLAASAELVTGDWFWQINTDSGIGVVSYDIGPSVFGHLPEPGVENRELAVLTAVYYSDGSVDLPLPVYEDGTVAAVEEVFWTFSLLPLPVSEYFVCPDNLYFFFANYNGGGELSIENPFTDFCSPSLPFQIVGIAARPMEPVGVSQDSFGGVKSMYEE